MTVPSSGSRQTDNPSRYFPHGAVTLLGILALELSVLGGVCDAFCPSRSLRMRTRMRTPIPMQIIGPQLVNREPTLPTLPKTTSDDEFPSRFCLALTMVSPSTSSSVLSSLNDSDNDHGDGKEDSGRRRRFMYMNEEEDRLLKEKGDLEERLMQQPTPLKAMKLTGLAKSTSGGSGKGMGMGMGGGGGFGGGGGLGGGKAGKKKGGKAKQTSKKQQQQQQQKQQETPAAKTTTVSPAVRALTKAIREDGLVRIDSVLSPEKADNLRDYLIDLRKRGRKDVESGVIDDSQERFADVLLNQNRCDLKIPLGPKAVHEALLDVLNDESSNKGSEDASTTAATANPSLVRNVIEGVFDHYNENKVYKGSEASLWELNCFMSNSGARRQLVHADCVCLEAVPGLQHTDSNAPGEDAGEPILLTCFIALQDIDASMGPTVFMPRTHNIRSHNIFFETGRDDASTPTAETSPKDDLMASSKSVVGAPIPKGSCIIFDPRVLHCAGANLCEDAEKTRALFYVTFKNPKVDSPGCPSTSGYGISTAELTMNELVSDLLVLERGDGTTAARRVPLLASSP